MPPESDDSGKNSREQLQTTLTRLLDNSRLLVQRLDARSIELGSSLALYVEAATKVAELQSELENWKRSSVEALVLSETLRTDLTETESWLAQSRQTLSELSDSWLTYRDTTEIQVTAAEGRVKTWRTVAAVGIPAGIVLGLVVGVLVR